MLLMELLLSFDISYLHIQTETLEGTMRKYQTLEVRHTQIVTAIIAWEK